MTQPNSESLHSHRQFSLDDTVSDGAPPLPAPPQPTDSAIDAALRSVPLPDGLLTRLDMLVASMSEEPANPVDWLGC